MCIHLHLPTYLTQTLFLHHHPPPNRLFVVGSLLQVHGAPLGSKDIADVKAKFGFDPKKSFEVKAEVGGGGGRVRRG